MGKNVKAESNGVSHCFLQLGWNMGWKRELWPEWEIVCDIGAGAYGTVYKMKRQDIGGTYYSALKVISFPHSKHEIEIMHNENMTDDQISEYYHCAAVDVSKEFAVMERLKGNTNIVSYEDHKIVPHNNGLGWDVLIRMELLTSLPDYLETHVITEKEVCRLGMDICNALILCEKENIIHRDIKPGNIFVSDFGDYKLGDFSLAKYAKLKSERSTPQGTYDYMAPEVYKGQGYDFTIDIYSLGLILYRLLNRGRGPFQPLPPQIITSEISEEANQKRLHTETLPKPAYASSMMSSIILKACAYNPEKRYKSAEDMHKALSRCSSAQTAIIAKKQISYYLMKAANALQDSYGEILGEDGESCGENDIVTISKETNANDDNNLQTCRNDDASLKKTMNDFFTSAGDL
ncbi:MAG: serine/threonine-protein kinase [Lachnospiraceae bacterium]